MDILASERQILHLRKKFFQTGYLKLNKGFATWFFSFCENFVQILKNHKNKEKDRYHVSMSLTCPISNGIFLLLKCSKIAS